MERHTQFTAWLKHQKIKDEEKWIRQFELAQEQQEQAMLNIALLYKDHGYYEEMYHLLRAAATSGNTDAMYELANSYFEALGSIGNEQEAFVLYSKAAQAGHQDAMNNLADMYLNGEATEVDEQKALYWFHQAADLGVPEAMFTLGMMYEQGLGIPCDDACALHYYLRSAAHGDVEAMYRLGMIFFSGELGQLRQEKKAVNWFLKAAAQFHVDALYNLGYCYEGGYGVDKDMKQALHYYKKAGLLGDIGAAKKLVMHFEQADSAEAVRWRERLHELEMLEHRKDENSP